MALLLPTFNAAKFSHLAMANLWPIPGNAIAWRQCRLCKQICMERLAIAGARTTRPSGVLSNFWDLLPPVRAAFLKGIPKRAPTFDNSCLDCLIRPFPSLIHFRPKSKPSLTSGECARASKLCPGQLGIAASSIFPARLHSAKAHETQSTRGS